MNRRCLFFFHHLKHFSLVAQLSASLLSHQCRFCVSISEKTKYDLDSYAMMLTRVFSMKSVTSPPHLNTVNIFYSSKQKQSSDFFCLSFEN